MHRAKGGPTRVRMEAGQNGLRDGAFGAVVLATWSGAYAFIFGLVLLALGLRLRHRTPGSSVRLPVS